MRGRLFYLTRVDYLYCALLLVIILWNEFLSFRWERYFWTIPDEKGNEDELRILLVADPQLIGYQSEHHLIGPILRWDADRYLSSGFQQALLSNPNMIFFLGDLFDEGVQASEEEFEWTVDRFHSIFADYDHQRIYISGDNDVGGEVEPVHQNLVDRFDNRFSNLVTSGHQLLQYVALSEVNAISKNLRNITNVEHPKLRIVLSHIPFLPSYHEQPISNVEADIFLSAHDHKAFSYVSSHTNGNVESADLSDLDLPIEKLIGRGELLLEFQSPTCSYRMGVPRMGYGFLFISPSSYPDKFIACYSVFWLPSRFHQLTLYIFIISIGFLRLLHKLFFSRMSFLHRSNLYKNIV